MSADPTPAPDPTQPPAKPALPMPAFPAAPPAASSAAPETPAAPTPPPASSAPETPASPAPSPASPTPETPAAVPTPPPAAAPAPAAAASSEPAPVLDKREMLRPRKRQRSEAEPANASMDPGMAALSAQLRALLGGLVPLPPEEDPEASETIVTAKNRRFGAKSNTPPAAKTALPAAFETADPTATPPKPGTASPADPTALKPPGPALEQPTKEQFRGQRRARQRQIRNSIIVAFVLVSGLMTLAYFVGKNSVPPPAPVFVSTPPPGGKAVKPDAIPPDLAPWPADALTKLDEILVTDQSGNREAALKAAVALRKDYGALPGLILYIGNIETRLMRPNDANATSSPLAAPDKPPVVAAPAYDQMGKVYSRLRDFPTAVVNFSKAAACDPLRGEYYYHWAEALRRRGKPEESISVFQQALRRLQQNVENDTLRRTVELKSRLAAIEINQGPKFKAEWDEQFKAPNIDGYWLLTAAALALQENRIPDAVDALQKAKAALPPLQYEDAISDYFFRGFALQNPTVSAIVLANDSERKLARRQSPAYFIDP